MTVTVRVSTNSLIVTGFWQPGFGGGWLSCEEMQEHAVLNGVRAFRRPEVPTKMDRLQGEAR